MHKGKSELGKPVASAVLVADKTEVVTRSLGSSIVAVATAVASGDAIIVVAEVDGSEAVLKMVADAVELSPGDSSRANTGLADATPSSTVQKEINTARKGMVLKVRI